MNQKLNYYVLASSQNLDTFFDKREWIYYKNVSLQLVMQHTINYS